MPSLFALMLSFLPQRAEVLSPLNRLVGPFVCRNESRLAALIRFGRENGLCFGIEFSDERLSQKAVIQVPQTTVQETVMAILDMGDTLKLSARNGVVLVGAR